MTLEELMLEEARRNLVRQEASLESLRTRVTAVLSVSAIVFAILGERQIEKLDAWGVLALISFVVSAGIAVFVLLPHDFAFGLKVANWMGQLTPERANARTAAWDAAHGLAEMYVTNKNQIKRLTEFYTAVCGLLAAQVVCWVLGGLR